MSSSKNELNVPIAVQDVYTPTVTPTTLTINSNTDANYIQIDTKVRIEGQINLLISTGTTGTIDVTLPTSVSSLDNAIFITDIPCNITGLSVLSGSIVSSNLRIAMTNGAIGVPVAFNLTYIAMYTT